jgi:hypothetical protein
MVSQLKSDTARTNGAKSRGPTTDEGKEKSSRNSLKHGLTATSGKILLDCEAQGEFDKIVNKLLGIHEPATPAEEDLVEEMVAARWRIRRIWTIETGLFNAEILTQQSNPGDPDIHLASAFRVLADDSRSLALANRYESRLQGLYDRTYKTLRELQQVRKSEPPEQPQNFQIKWVAPQEEMDSRAAEAADGMDMRAAEPANAATPTPTPTPPPTAPSVSEGERGDSPAEPRASASGPALPNEPTAATNKELSPDPSNDHATPPPPTIRNPTSAIRNAQPPLGTNIQHPSPPSYNEK